jgi:signal transduction histidine kinase
MTRKRLWFPRAHDLAAERDQLAGELRSAQAQIASLTQAAIVLDERERLAREIHDTIAQDLTNLVLTVQRSRRELRYGNAPGAATQLVILEDSMRRALKDTRALVASGVPVGIEGGLTTALNQLGDQFEVETNISVTVRARGTADLSPETESMLLHCAREALTNVREHSHASAASVTVSTTHGSAVLRVADNGHGYETGDTIPHDDHGLARMRDLLVAANGSLSIISAPGKGTALIASLPDIPSISMQGLS